MLNDEIKKKYINLKKLSKYKKLTIERMKIKYERKKIEYSEIFLKINLKTI